jgi:hypothetical protein
MTSRSEATAGRDQPCVQVWRRVGIRGIAEEVGPLTENDPHGMKSLAARARSVLSDVQQDDRVKHAAAVTQDAAARAQEAGKTVTRKVTQEDAWEELRADVEQLTEVARAHHALIVDLIDRVGELETRTGTKPGPGPDA